MDGISAYRENTVTTESKGRLIVLLYDGAIKFLRLAQQELDAGDFAVAELVKQSAGEVEIRITSTSGEWRVKLNRTGAPGGRIKRGDRVWELPVNLQPNHEP